MVHRHSPIDSDVLRPLSTRHLPLTTCPLPLAPYPSPLATCHLPLATRYSLSSSGFTLIEMLIILFLLAAVLVIVLPRVVIGEDLSSTGRKLIGTFRTLQGLASTGQKPVKLYLDLDQGTYWVRVVDGKEEKLPLDASWATPQSLPETIRFSEISVRQDKRTYGRIDLSFFPNGRIDPVTVYLIDRSNNLLVLTIDPFTGAIRTREERIDPLRSKPIPDRVKMLLRPTGT